MTWNARSLDMLRHYPDNPAVPEHLRPNKLMREAADRIEQLQTVLETVRNEGVLTGIDLILSRPPNKHWPEAAERFQNLRSLIDDTLGH